MYQAKLKRSPALVGALVLFAGLTLWGLRHIQNIVEAQYGHSSAFTVVYAMSFAILTWQTLLYSLERPYKATTKEQKRLDKVRVVANVPVCNEDPEALQQCIDSMVNQSRPIDLIHVVVNGPNTVDYTAVKAYVLTLGKAMGVDIRWDVQKVAGKRMAQALTAHKYLRPKDIFLTIDSDAYLDQEAVEEGLQPFVKQNIMSVAGIVLTINNRKQFMTRMQDLWFLVGQLVDRSANSTLGSVLVNSGVLAFYRGHLILDNLEGYTNEHFFDRKIEFSDDSLLTLYALQVGKAVQQPTSFAFTLMPENFNHHFRQQLRWMRGAFIRSWWRFKYLRLNGYAYWSHLLGWTQVFLSTGLFLYLFLYMPVVDAKIIPWLVIVPLCVGYAQGLRYLTIWRSDESFWYRFATYLCSPIPGLWSFFVLRWVRWYAVATCLKTGWGTRQAGAEVGITPLQESVER